jgi:hypothetical protein
MTLRRATLFATIATALLVLIFVIRYVVPLFSVSGALPIIVYFALPAELLQLVLWPAFYFSLYGESPGTPSRVPSRRIALLLAVILTVSYSAGTIVAAISFPEWLSVAERSSPLPLLTLLARVAFLITFWAGPEQPRVRSIALGLAVILCVSGLFESLQGLRPPAYGLWPFVVRPLVPTLAWVSEAAFFWLFWKTPPVTERIRQN